MNFSWRRRRGGRGGATTGENQDIELTIPIHFKCPISLDLMKDPVTLSTGITYDRESIERWIEAGNFTCPVTNQVLRTTDQIPNHSIRKMIQDWCVQNKSCGVERIPTPRIPITAHQVSDIRARIEAATISGDATKCKELLRKIKNLAKESERNKRCMVVNGIGSVLANSFETFAISNLSMEDADVNDLLKEMLSALTWALFPNGQEISTVSISEASVRCMAWFLKSDNDLSSRRDAICVLRELIISSYKDEQGSCVVEALRGIQGIEECLTEMVKVPICPRATKASLVVIHHMMMVESIASTFVQMGLFPLVLEILVDGDKSACEKALVVIDDICSWRQGREIAHENALTIPLLVKKMLRVSDMATQLSVSTIWKLLCSGDGLESAGAGAVTLTLLIELGAFQKLLVLLQIGTYQTTKDKLTDLLKLMNLYRDKLDCVHSSMGFKYIKRSI